MLRAGRASTRNTVRQNPHNTLTCDAPIGSDMPISRSSLSRYGCHAAAAARMALALPDKEWSETNSIQEISTRPTLSSIFRMGRAADMSKEEHNEE